MWQGWINGILGLWLIVTAFLNFSPKGNLWNDLIVGIIVAVLGFWIVKPKPWQGWLAGIVGILLIITAFIPSLMVHSAHLWVALIGGILVAIAGFGAVGGSES